MNKAIEKIVCLVLIICELILTFSCSKGSAKDTDDVSLPESPAVPDTSEASSIVEKKL